MVIVIVRVRIVVIILSGLCSLPLRILLIFHPSVLEPYFDLPFGEVQISREFPSFLLRNVRIEQELFL